jgi:hypothetical protein
MTEKEFNICVGKILAGKSLNEEDAINFVETINEMESMLDDGDQEDFFGTEGWRHVMGWD